MPLTVAITLGSPALFLALQALLVVGGLRASRVGAPWLRRALVAAAPVGLCVSYAFWRDVLAPRVLGLPYHRCVHELLTDTVALGPAALMTLAATACTLCTPLAHGAPALSARLFRAATLGHASALVLVAAHLV